MVQGDGIGRKIVVLPDAMLGSVGSMRARCSERFSRAQELLVAEKSETRSETDPESGAEVDLFYRGLSGPADAADFRRGACRAGVDELAKVLGFRVIVTDARAKLATEERFPGRGPDFAGLAG